MLCERYHGDKIVVLEPIYRAIYRPQAGWVRF